MSEMHDPAANREYYRHEYDSRRTLDQGILAHYAAHFRRFARAFHLASGQRVLDIGSGKGYWLRQVAPSARLAVGVDLSQPSLLTARSHVPAQFLAADVMALPFLDNSFDAAFSFEVFEHTLDPGAAVREAYRVLKPGGTLVLLQQFRLDDYQKLHESLSRWKARMLRRPPRPFAALETLHINQLRPDDWCALLGRCGFTEVKALPLSVLPPYHYLMPRLRRRFFDMPVLSPLDRWLCGCRWLTRFLAISFFYVACKPARDALD